MRKRVFMLLALCMCLVLPALAQSKITGTIVEETNGKAIPFVNVGLFRQADSVFVSGAASDDKGKFELVAPNGDYRLQVSAIGFQTFEQLLTVKGNQDLGQLKLSEGATKLGEVVIAEKRPLFAVEGEKTMYNVAEDPSIQTGTLSDALQNAPGVEVDVEGNITLRGTSSVEVWINDKPSHMTAENLKTYIQTLPANSLDRVEVITNPSARYGSKADGIINIVTNAKIQKNEFFSFGVNASTSPYIGPWASYVWSNDKLTFNAYINGGYSNWKGYNNMEQSLFTDEGILASHEFDSSNYSSKNYNTGGYFSLDYEIDTANSINVWFSAWPSWGGNTNYTELRRDEFLPNPLFTAYTENADAYNRNFFANGGLYYMHKFNNKGHNLSISVNGMGWGGANGGDVKRQFTAPIEYTHLFRQENSENSVGVEGEVVYNRPYSENGEISVGYTVGYDPEHQYLKTDSLVGEDWVNDVYRTYKANFTNLNNETFITVQHKFGGFTVKPGIRFVSELVSGDYPYTFPNDTTDYNFSKHFFSVRPSLHLSYRTKSMHNFKLSYTMRITSPNAELLSKFPLYHMDSYSTGNPDLDRVYTHSVEAGWTKYWDKFGSVGLSAYYRGKNNEVNSIQVSSDSSMYWLYGRPVPYSYPVNVGKSYTTGLEYNMMYRPSGFFNLRFYANLYDSYLETDYNGQHYIQPDMWSYSFRLNLWAKLWNKLEVTASGYYSSPTQSLFSERLANYGINAGLRADFFDRKLSVYVNANDIFNWNRWGRTNSSPYVQSTSTYKPNSRSIAVGLTFRFGKMELEQRARQGEGDSGSAPQGMGGM